MGTLLYSLAGKLNTQQDQLMRNNAAAVREAVLAQERPALNPDTPLVSTEFKRRGGWSADEVARLHHNDPRLLEDPFLACWRRTIVHTAGPQWRLRLLDNMG